MTIQITLPLKLIRLQKLASVDVPISQLGAWEGYIPGSINPGVSLPVDYWIIGWLLRPPTVGEVVIVLRIIRNGVVFPGQLTTTPIMAVRGDEFHTMNSIYRWEEIA